MSTRMLGIRPASRSERFCRTRRDKERCPANAPPSALSAYVMRLRAVVTDVMFVANLAGAATRRPTARHVLVEIIVGWRAAGQTAHANSVLDVINNGRWLRLAAPL